MRARGRRRPRNNYVANRSPPRTRNLLPFPGPGVTRTPGLAQGLSAAGPRAGRGGASEERDTSAGAECGQRSFWSRRHASTVRRAMMPARAALRSRRATPSSDGLPRVVAPVGPDAFVSQAHLLQRGRGGDAGDERRGFHVDRGRRRLHGPAFAPLPACLPSCGLRPIARPLGRLRDDPGHATPAPFKQDELLGTPQATERLPAPGVEARAAGA